MQSTFSGIEIGKRSLFASQVALNTIGHNVSNANTPGYSRQRVELQTFPPIYYPQLNRAEISGQIGQGVTVESVNRIKDMILEQRIVSQTSLEGYWNTRDNYLLMLDQVYNEPADISVRGHLDRFWSAWQELSIHPEQISAREAVLQRGAGLSEAINQRYRSLDQIRTMLDDDIRATVKQVNDLLGEIAELNVEIVRVQALGDNPNDLLDRRDLLTERLGGLINITTDGRDEDEFNIHTEGYHLVQGGIVRPLEIRPDPQNEGYTEVVWSENLEEENAGIEGGVLGALIELRDQDVRQEIQNLDMMSVNFMDMVNEIHREGYGLNGRTGRDFFVQYPFVNNALGNYDRNGDGEFDSTYIFRMSGTNSLNMREQIGLAGTMILSGPDGNREIEYFPTDTVADVISRINTSGAEVVATLNIEGELTLKAAPAENMDNPDFVVRHVEDTGQFLAGYAGILTEPGPAGAYDWENPDAVLDIRGGAGYAVTPLMHPSAYIAVNPELQREPATVAASFGVGDRAGELGNGEAALAIAGLRNSPVMLGQISTFDDYFANTVAEIGLKGEQAEIAARTQEQIILDLRNTRESISGVNIDEELAEMIKFQHGYAAAARFINQINTMLDTIINRMGV
ncbi:MAG: flagellar hook-associated protein FlgK [Spirochaetia bacterium]